MNILYYNDLDYTKIEKKYKKVIQFLSKGDFKSADVKKFENHHYYRAKLDDTNRLLFRIAKYKGQSYIQLLEIIMNHDYEKSKFLKGVHVDENKLVKIESEIDILDNTVSLPVYINSKRKEFQILDKIISLDEEQNEIFNLPTPQIIIGSAGSGKTVLTLLKMRALSGNILYVSNSSYLVENAQKLYYSYHYENEKQDIEFLSFKEYLSTYKIPKGIELIYKYFDAWFIKYQNQSKIKDSFRLYEEIKGVLTGSVVDKPYMTKEEYLLLGIKQSIFLKEQREEVYSIFEKYLKFIEESNFYELNLLSYQYQKLVEKKYDYIIIDEVQDFTNIQIKLIINALKDPTHFIFSGDSNQIVHPNFFSWSKIKSMFWQDGLDATIYRILQANYRNSQSVIEISNKLLKIKNARFGSIDKESTYLIEHKATTQGGIHLLNDNEKLKNELNQKTKNSIKYAVLVLNNSDKNEAKKYFETPLIFSIQEAKGLEYENIIIYNFITQNDKEFFELTRELDSSVLEDEIKYARARNKEDKDLEVYKFFVNSFYVALTRAIQNVYIVEKNNRHPLFQLLALNPQEKTEIVQPQQSNVKDWLDEAMKLEKQGKHDQAQEIRDRIMGLEYISPEQYEELKLKALDPNKKEHEVKNERKQLYRYAEARKQIEIITSLAKLQYSKAVQYMKELRLLQNESIKSLKAGKTDKLKTTNDKYGIDMPIDDKNNTSIMIASTLGKTNLVKSIMEYEPDITLFNTEKRNVLHVLIHSFYTYNNVHTSIRNNYCSLEDFSKIVKIVYPQKTKFKIGDVLIKLNISSMEYFLINMMYSIQPELYSEKQKKFDNIINQYREDFRKQALKIYVPDLFFTIDDFEKLVNLFTDKVLSPNRLKRTYINSILSNNEVDSKYLYNKRLFKRVTRGGYILNPDLSFTETIE